MDSKFIRTKLILGKPAMERLKESKIAIFGVGGVGGAAAEALVRSGVYNFKLIDYDVVIESNLNRHIHSTIENIGYNKVGVMKQRMLSINPYSNIEAVDEMYTEENKDKIITDDIDYIIDAIDMVSAKLSLIKTAKEKKIPIISAMGAGHKLDPTRLEISDIYKTSYCPLAKAVRLGLKGSEVKKLKVVFSKEIPVEFKEEVIKSRKDEKIIGSAMFVTATMGLILASEVIKDITKEEV